MTLNSGKLFRLLSTGGLAMPKVSLSRLDVQSLMDLRKQVEATLVERRAVIEKQLALLDGDKVARRGGPRKIVVPMAKPGQDAVLDPAGLLLRSRVEGNSIIS